ncbi:Vacuolar protein sorting-associated protein 20, partial [Ascosphaera atra]
AILDLKNQRDNLHRYQKRITKLTDRETEIARQCLAQNDKPRALLALRRKKYQQSLLAQTDSQLEQLEKLVGNVEFALVQKDVLYGLKQGNEVLKTIHQEMGGLEGVEKLMGETEDARAYQEEVSRMLAGQMSTQDEEDVEDELEAMEREASGVPARKQRHPHLPEAPKTEPKDRGEAIEQEEESEEARENARRVADTTRQMEAMPL